LDYIYVVAVSVLFDPVLKHRRAVSFTGIPELSSPYSYPNSSPFCYKNFFKLHLNDKADQPYLSGWSVTVPKSPYSIKMDQEAANISLFQS